MTGFVRKGIRKGVWFNWVANQELLARACLLYPSVSSGTSRDVRTSTFSKIRVPDLRRCAFLRNTVTSSLIPSVAKRTFSLIRTGTFLKLRVPYLRKLAELNLRNTFANVIIPSVANDAQGLERAPAFSKLSVPDLRRFALNSTFALASFLVPDGSTLTNLSERTDTSTGNRVPCVNGNAHLWFRAESFIALTFILVPEGSFRTLPRLTNTIASALVLDVSLGTPSFLALAVAGLLVPVAVDVDSVARSKYLFIALASA